MRLSEAMKLRENIELAVQSLSDKRALESVTLFPSWSECVKKGTILTKAGFKFHYAGKLYKCIHPDPTFQNDWIPGVGTESLYTIIDMTHTGTLDDPIPYDGNMDLESGKYYMQNDVIYLCNRNTGTAVFELLANLEGIYVERI